LVPIFNRCAIHAKVIVVSSRTIAAAVRAAQIALEGTQQEALVGTRTVLDVLIQNQQLLTTQSQLVTAQHDAALAEFNLAASVGRLIAPELKLPVRLYDMERHYKEVKDKWMASPAVSRSEFAIGAAVRLANPLPLA
jgi:hypothetical protein